MKIGYDAKRAFHNQRGLGNYSRTLLLSLFKYYGENDYSLFTPNFDESKMASFYKEAINHSNIVTPSGLKSLVSPVWRSYLLSGELESHNLDIYHGLSHELPSAIEKTNVTKMVTMHDLLFMRFPHFFPWIDRQIYKRKFTHACEVSDVVISTCEQTKSDLVNMLGVKEEKIHTVYQSCDPRYFEMNDSEELIRVKRSHKLERPYIFYCGAIVPLKNALGLTKAFKKIMDKVDHDLVLVGHGKEYKKEIETYISQNSMQNRVKLLGHVPLEDMPSLYQAAELFVFPSFFEGFGIPIIESLFSETPVITSEGSCFPESGGPGTIYINPNDNDQLAHEMLRVIEDKLLQETMKSTGREFVQKFHWKNTSKNLNELYTTYC